MRFCRKKCKVLALALATAIAVTAIPRIATADFVVIVKTSSAVEKISKATLRDIYLGNRTFLEDGSRVFAVRPTDEKLAESFLQAIVHMNMNDFDTHWRRRLFAGKAIPPKRFDNIKQLIDYVAEEPNAIGFVDDKDTAGNSKVKTLKITD